MASRFRPILTRCYQHSCFRQTLKAYSPHDSSSSVQRGSSRAKKRPASSRNVQAVSRCTKWCSLSAKYLEYTLLSVCLSESMQKLKMIAR